MKITMYDLLGMVKDGKAPKKIKYQNCEYNLYDNKSYLSTDKTRLFNHIYFSDLNAKVEILEEEKEMLEKLEYEVSDENGEFSINGFTFDFEQKIQIITTVNEIIDFLKQN